MEGIQLQDIIDNDNRDLEQDSAQSMASATLGGLVNTQTVGPKEALFNKTLTGSLQPAGAWALDKLGMEDAAQSVMKSAGVNYGYSDEMGVETEGNEFTNFAQYLAPSALGTSIARGAIKGFAGKELNKLVAKKTMGRKLGEESLDLATQNTIITAGDVTSGKYNEDGEFELKTGDTKDYFQMYAANLAGDALFSMGATSAAFKYNDAMQTRKISKSFDGADYSDFNIDNEGVAVINKPILDGKTIKKDDGLYTKPEFYVNEAVETSSFDEVIKTGNFEGLITDGSGNYAKINTEGDVSLSSNTRAPKQGDIDVVTFDEAKVRIDNTTGMMTLDSYNDMMGTTFKSVNDIKAADGIPYSVIDKTGAFRTVSDTLGDIRGKAFNGQKVVNLKTSDVTKDAKGMTYGNKHLMKGMSKDTAMIKALFGEDVPNETSKAMTDLKQFFEFDETGNIVKKAQPQKRLKEDMLDAFMEGDDPNMTLLKQAEARAYNATDSVTAKRNLNPNDQVLLAEELNLNNIKDTEIGKLKSFINMFDNTYSAKASALAGTFDIQAVNSANLKSLEQFFTTSQNADGSIKIGGFKKEFAAALDAAYALEIMKQKKVGELIEPGKMTQSIFGQARSLLGIEDANGFMESTLKDLEGTIAADASPDNITSGTANLTLQDGKVVRGEKPDPALQQAIEEFGPTPEDRSYNVNMIRTNGSTMEKRGMIFTGKAGQIKDKYGLLDKNADPVGLDLADTMRQTRYDFTDSSVEILNQFSALAHAPRGDMTKFSAADIKLAYYTGKIDPTVTAKELSNWKPNAKLNLREAIDNVRQEILYLERANKLYDDNLGIYFDVEYDINGRVRYMGVGNPQSSTIGRIVLTTDKSDLKLFKDGIADTKAIETAQRSMLANFGVKVETIHDTVKINDMFNELSRVTKGIGLTSSPKTLLKRLESSNTKYDYGFDIEKVISMATVKQIGSIDNAIKGRLETPVTVFSEIDSKLSGVAIAHALVGEVDTRMGIGGKISAETDIYTQLSDQLGISRAEAKPGVIGDNYSASPYTSSLAMSEFILNDYMKTGTLNPKVAGIYNNFVATNAKLLKVIGRKDQLVKILNDVSALKEANPDIPASELLDNIKLADDARMELNRLAELENNNKFLGTDVYTLASGILELEYGKNLLSDPQLDAINHMFARVLEPEVTTALSNLYAGKPMIKQLRKDMATFSYHAQEGFAFRYVDTNMNKATMLDTLQKMLKDLGQESDTSAVKNVLEGISEKKFYSLKDLVEGLIYTGKVSSNIYSIPAIRDIIPVMEIGNGKTIPLVTIKGFAGYRNGINFKGPTPIQVFQPVFTISHDAFMMGSTLKKGMTNLSDAVVGASGVVEGGNALNKAFAGVAKHNNPYEMMQKVYESINENVGSKMSNTKLAEQVNTYMAQQDMLQRGKNVGNEELLTLTKSNHKERSMATDQAFSDAMTNVEAMKEVVDTNKKTNYGNDTVIDNYSNGQDGTATTIGEAIDITHNKQVLGTGEMAPTSYRYTLEAMKDIDYTDAPAVGGFTDMHGNSPTAKYDTTFKFAQPKSEVVGRNVSIKYEAPSFEAFRDIVHESTHVATEYKDFGPLQATIIEWAGNGKITDMDYNSYGFALDTTSINNMEPLSQVMHTLYTNELLMGKSFELAKSFGEKDLSKHIVPLKIDGTDMYTTKDLYEHLKALNKTDEASLLSELSRDTLSVVNGSVDIYAFLNGHTRDKFDTVLKDLGDAMIVSRVSLNKVNEKIGAVGFGDLFTLDTEKDALEYALSLKQGGDNAVQSMVSNFKTEVDKLVDFPDNPRFDESVGNMSLLGMNRFMDAIEGSKTSKEFFDYINAAMGKRRKAIKDVLKAEPTDLTMLTSGIKSLAFGKDSNLTPKRLAVKILRKRFPFDETKVRAEQSKLANYIIDEAAYQRTTKYKSSVKSIFGDLVHDSQRTNAVNLLTMLNTEYKNSNTLFGGNAAYNLTNNNMRGKAVKASDFDGKQSSIIGEGIVNGEKYYAVAKSDNAYWAGEQATQVMDLDVSDAAKGIYRLKVGQDNYLTINPTNINTKNKYVDTRITSQLQRNLYSNQMRDIGSDIQFRQFEALKDGGILLTEQQFTELPDTTKGDYMIANTATGKTNPFNEQFGKHYYNVKWAKYLEGSKGMNVGAKQMSKVFGKQFGPLLSAGVKGILNATQALKGPILVYRPASYINSFLSSMMIYGINGDQVQGPKAAYHQAKATIDSYKDATYQATRLDITPEERTANLAKLKKHELYDAWMSGIASTIRSDAYTTGSLAENQLYTHLKTAFGNDRAAETAKTLLADPSTKWGNSIGEIFDNTEMVPKVMMYLANKKRAGHKGAIQEVLLAFPTYNNLGPILNGIDQISPYTKYMASYPKMAMYSLRNNRGKLAVAQAAFFLGVRTSYGDELATDEEWWYDNNFINLMGGYKSWESLNPYWVPSKQIDGFGVFDAGFIPSAVDTLTDPMKTLSPITIPSS